MEPPRPRPVSALRSPSSSLKYKLLALDVDGTLLRRDGSIHREDLAAIVRLQAAGVFVTLVTGRLYSGTRDVARQAGIIGPVACVDGSHIVDTHTDTHLFSCTITGTHAARLRDIAERHQAACFLFAQDSIVHDPLGDPFIHYVRTWSPNIAVVDRVTSHPYWDHDHGVLALVAVGSQQQILDAADEIRTELANIAFVLSFPILRSTKFAMVVRASGASKGTAISWLAAHHGYCAKDVVAVGDWINDVPMFQMAGRSFAMRQAPEAVRHAATDVLEADGVYGGGIAEAIFLAFGL